MKTTKQKNSLGFNFPFDVHRDIDRTKYLLLIHIVNFINIATTDDYLLFHLYFHFFLFVDWAEECNILISKSTLAKAKAKSEIALLLLDRMWWCVLDEIPNEDKKNNENGCVFIYFNNWWQMKISTSFNLSIIPFRHVSRPPDKTQTQFVRTSRTFIFHCGDDWISRHLINNIHLTGVASWNKQKTKNSIRKRKQARSRRENCRNSDVSCNKRNNVFILVKRREIVALIACQALLALV